jgi:cytochrome c5
MRERIAVAISILTVTLLVALAGVFASRQSAADGRQTAPPELVDAAAAPESERPEPHALARDSAWGRELFLAHGCARCHSVERVGSPRYPLDGVGARRGRAELRAWTLGEGAVADSLSPSAARAKRRYLDIPADGMDALLTYMELLRRPR